MQTVTIQTTQNIDIDYEVAGLGERVLARLIDIGAFIALGLIELFLSLFAGWRGTAATVLIFSFLVLYVFYDLACEMFFNGQSFGKRMMKIKVISISGSRPNISQYVLRWLFRIVDFALTSGLCALISVAVSEKKQRVGDLVAGTTLIKTKPRTEFGNLVFAPVDQTYTPVFTQVTELKDDDIVLIHDVLASFNKTGNGVLVYNMAKRVKDHLSIVTPAQMTDYQFLRAVINDYNHIASKTEV